MKTNYSVQTKVEKTYQCPEQVNWEIIKIKGFRVMYLN